MTAPAPPRPALELAARWWDVAKLLLDCLCTGLAATVGGPPCRCLIMPGQATIADTCEAGPGGDGQAWVRRTNTFLTQQYPVPVSGAGLALSKSATFEVGVLRCGHSLGAGGEAPNVADLEADACKVWDDEAVLRRLDCCLPTKFKPMIGLWTPLSGGGCTGGMITMTVLMAPGPIAAAVTTEEG